MTIFQGRELSNVVGWADISRTTMKYALLVQWALSPRKVGFRFRWWDYQVYSCRIQILTSSSIQFPGFKHNDQELELHPELNWTVLNWIWDLIPTIICSSSKALQPISLSWYKEEAIRRFVFHFVLWNLGKKMKRLTNSSKWGHILYLH